jgi:phage/plasmid primase-like uncharacterized protein/phage/plasmid-associated DNA primase
MTLDEFAQARGFEPRPCDGTFYRFERSGDMTGWWRGKTYVVGDKQVCIVHFGDWRTDEKYEWRSEDEQALSQGEREKLAAEVTALQAKEREERAAEQVRVADECRRLWDSQCVSLGESPYLAKKGLPRGLFGTRLRPLPDGILTVAPLCDGSQRLWGLQYISPDGRKNFSAGARIKGCFHLIGEIPAEGGGVIHVCEGIATGASISLAHPGVPVVCAFNAGNLTAVAQTLRGNYPTARIVVCGDDDRWTRRPDGTPWNPGREKALAAAKSVGGVVCFPRFSSLDGRPTDFNDLHVREGLEQVKKQLDNPSADGTATGDATVGPPGGNGQASPRRGVRTASGDIEPLPIRMSKGGMPMAPTQQRVAEHLLDYFDGALIKQERDLFRYDATHWKLLTQADHDRLKVLIQRACSGHGDVKHVDSCYKLFIYHLPAVPNGIDMFTPVPNAANFSNGTLWAEKQRAGGFELAFRAHRKEDYLINVLPYEYRPWRELPENPEFTKMVERVFAGNPDAGQKTAAIRQMYGACLMPLRPHLFMLHGPPGTGKSTVIKIAARLVAKDNLCSVAPSHFHGFNMETMAGKLVNVDTDIPFDEPIRDEIVKKIEDRGLFRIRRKGVKDLLAPLPPVHLFGGNDIPKALDGASGAHARRWSFIGFSSFVPAGQYDKDYWDYCFEQGPQGVLRFALQGLEELLVARGHYLNPESGVEAMRQWQLKSDVIGQFVQDVENGEAGDENTQVRIGQDRRIERTRLWTIFQKWHVEAQGSAPRMGRNTFFEALRRKKFGESKIMGVRYINGIGSEAGPNAQM